MPANKPPFDGEWVKVAEVFNLQIGKTPSRKKMEYWNTGEYDWVSIKDLGSYGRFVGRTKETISELGRIESGIKQVPSNTLLMSFKLSLGKTSITTRPIYTNEAIMAFLDKGTFQFDLGYMWHQFRTKDWATGTNMAVMGETLNKKTLGSALIRLPDLRTQRMVASHLDVIQGQLEIAAKKLERLDTLVKSRFVEMFGDPAENTMSWDSASLTSLGRCKNGMNFKSKESGIELPCLGVGDFKDRTFINGVSEMGRVNLDTMPSEGYSLKDGDIVFVRSNGNKRLVGRCLAVFPNGEKAVYSGFCIRLRIESDRVRIPYLVWALRHPSMRQQMFGRGANVQNLNQKLMSNVEVPIPPLPEQDCFLDFVAEVDKSRFVVQQKIEKLQMLYDSLAQEYFG